MSSLNMCFERRVNHSLVRPPSSTPCSSWKVILKGVFHSSTLACLISSNESSKAWSRLTKMSHWPLFYFCLVFLSMTLQMRRLVSNSRICGIFTTRFLSWTLTTCWLTRMKTLISFLLLMKKAMIVLSLLSRVAGALRA